METQEPSGWHPLQCVRESDPILLKQHSRSFCCVVAVTWQTLRQEYILGDGGIMKMREVCMEGQLGGKKVSVGNKV